VAQERIREELIPKIKQLCAHVLGPRRPALIPPRLRPPQTDGGANPLTHTRATPRVGASASAAGDRALRASGTGTADGRISVLAIGCSTGGPNALVEIIPKFPADLPVPVVITQHMPPMFTKFLADRLNAMSAVTVKEATEGDVLVPGTVWIAPGDFHLVLERQGGQVVTTLSKAPPENSCRPSVDVMLRSVVACYDHRVLSVILTGMGQDGLHGCELVHEVGGRVLTQDEASSVVWGMPGFVARAEIAEAIVPLAGMAEAIIDRIRRAGATVPIAGRLAPRPRVS
jgi:two-component system chemotaxis response regulator CheB